MNDGVLQDFTDYLALVDVDAGGPDATTSKANWTHAVSPSTAILSGGIRSMLSTIKPVVLQMSR